MGKSSRIKRERKAQGESGQIKNQEQNLATSGWEKFLAGIVSWGAYLAILTPIIYSKYYYFPFVGPKSVYFLAFCEIVFFAWLLLALRQKKYRPRRNAVLIAFAVFIFLMIVATIFGVDPSRSFWSKFERMTGLLTWLHIFGFFLAVSSTFKTVGQWKKLFFVSLGVALIVAFLGLAERFGVKALTFSDRKGATLGNSSFLGSYLVFNFFLSLYLAIQERKQLFLRYGMAGLSALFLATMYLQKARAAWGSVLGGLILIGLLFWAFKIKNKKLAVVGKIVLIGAVLVVIASVVLLYLPNNPVHNLFGKIATQGRFANWGIAWKGFLERPFFGWGPETYDILFPKYFNPCLFTQKCGGEFWFDRTHNIILDTLVATGLFGFLAYLGLFVVCIWTLAKKYFKQKAIDFWTFALFCALPVAYFIQNLTVFDMIASLMMFGLFLSFVGFLAVLSLPEKEKFKSEMKGPWTAVLVLAIFVLFFNYFVYKPWQLDKSIIKAVQAQYQNDRLALYDKTLAISSLGKYQITDFFADHSLGLVQNNAKQADREVALKELDWAIQATEKIHKASPLDYRITLKLAQIYNSAVVFDYSKLTLAEQYAQEAMKQSPNNQQSYWVLSQVKLFQQDAKSANELAQKAIDIEPGVLKSYQVASQVAKISGSQAQAIAIAKKAVAFNPDWQTEFPDLLPQPATTSKY